MPRRKEQLEPPTAAAFLPEKRTLPSLEAAAADCRGCNLYERATQTVFGEGPAKALMVIVGEQPGDQEDIAGKPFVGPAGRLLDRALAAAGIRREQTYVTNAVKHFKWVARGKRRLHDKPRRSEILACRPWLEHEIAAIQPLVIVCLGATASQSLMGPDFKITQQRGRLIETQWAPWLVATLHPSALIRMRDERERERAFQSMVQDLRVAADKLKEAVARR